MVLGWPSYVWKTLQPLPILIAYEFKAQDAAGRKFYRGKGEGREEEEKGKGGAKSE